MTEAKWLTSNDANAMFWSLFGSNPRRKAPVPEFSRRLGSLFAVACLRATPQVQEQPFLRDAIDVVETAVERDRWREVTRLDKRAREACANAYETAGLDSVPHFWALAALRLTQGGMEHEAVHVPYFVLCAIEGAPNVKELRKIYADLLRDIVGNPFRGGRGCQFDKKQRKQVEPIFRPDWRTDTVLSLAKLMYENREFSAMPILADALQDAGCENEAILNHCRNEQIHARGCWVVDLILRKS